MFLIRCFFFLAILCAVPLLVSSGRVENRDGFCYYDFRGDITDSKYETEYTLPRGVYKKSIKINSECLAVRGMNASACSEVPFTLAVTGPRSVYVSRAVADIEVDVHVDVYCGRANLL